MKKTILTLFAILSLAAPALAADANYSGLPPGCVNLIKDARACIPKGTPPDAVERINHVLDMMADNIRGAEPSERQEVCQATITSYRQMSDLVCASARP